MLLNTCGWNLKNVLGFNFEILLKLFQQRATSSLKLSGQFSSSEIWTLRGSLSKEFQKFVYFSISLSNLTLLVLQGNHNKVHVARVFAWFFYVLIIIELIYTKFTNGWIDINDELLRSFNLFEFSASAERERSMRVYGFFGTLVLDFLIRYLVIESLYKKYQETRMPK